MHEYENYGFENIIHASSTNVDFSETELFVLERIWLTYGNKSYEELEAINMTAPPYHNTEYYYQRSCENAPSVNTGGDESLFSLIFNIFSNHLGCVFRDATYKI